MITIPNSIAPVGGEFNVAALLIALDGSTRLNLFGRLRRMQAAGLVRFTGKSCTWQRLV